MARSVESSRDNGQSSESDWRITGSMIFCFSTTPARIARNHCASASRYTAPSTSLPRRNVSYSAVISSSPLPATSIWYSACTAASRAAPRLLAWRVAGPSLPAAEVTASGSQPLANRDHGESSARREAALVAFAPPRAHPGLRLVFDRQYAVADRQRFLDRQIHQRSAR